ncbi:cell wall protein Ecm33 [Coemansia biformis]|uniref:Cell wall protein Ecm33 n=1 Tax=Coemansia biformis TaxID=1286918 RepID=A0A9W7YBB4_9FUNG|nr:cell wall protein Ecm33 [Coemansia biformis]
MKCVLALSALAALAAGACNKDIKVKSQSDINTVNACSKFDADVIVDGVSGIGALNMDNVQSITGQLVIQNMYDLQTVSLASLTSARSLKVLNNTNVYKVDIPKLSSVDDLQIIVNPNLKELSYRNITSVNNFQIIGTHISSLGQFMDSEPGNIEVLSNTELRALDFSSVKKTTGYINVANNGRSANITFSSLTDVGGNASFADASTLDIHRLSSVADDFSLYTNSFRNLSVPALKTADKSITISGNSFEVIAFPQLTEIGSSLNIVNNTNFRSITDKTFPKLQSIPGSMVLQGSFDNITFPALKNVDGQVSLSGKGKLSCKEAEAELKAADNIDCSLVVTDSSSGGSSDSESDGSGSEASGAPRAVVATAVIGGALALAAICL